MNNVSSYNSAVRGYDRGELERFSSRSSQQRESVELSTNQSLELSLTTKEGDVVTLSTESFMDFASLSYDKSGTVSDGNRTASASFSSREMTLASGSAFSFSVQGNLSEEELDDIENLVKTLDEVAYEMSTGDMDEAMETALGMSEGYDSVSGFEADISMSSSYRYEKEVAQEAIYSERGSKGAREYGRSHNPNLQAMTDAFGTAQEENEGASSIFANSSSRLLDMMLEEMEKMKEKGENVPTRAADPVDQMLAHHMDLLDVDGEDDLNDEGGRANGLFNQQLATTREGLKSEFGREFERMLSESFSSLMV